MAAVAFTLQCRIVGLPEPVAEHRFHPTRKWRIDYAWPEQKLALEVEGGVFIQGRHVRGIGMVKDMEKYGELAVMGWRLLRVTPKQIRDGSALALVRRAFTEAA
jgi:very-short-patch-repair endonuclease